MEVEKIMVSIVCTAYNHEAFIRQCLDGFMMQVCNFNIEVIIHDDASTDNTAVIIKEYQNKYPEIIKPIYQSVNQASQEKGRVTKIVLGAAKGKYIALCEGDDYWTDPFKLQKQVDFLKNNLDFSLCFTSANVVSEQHKNINTKGLKFINKSSLISSTQIYLNWIIPTASVVFKKEIIDESFYKILSNDKILYGDLLLYIYLSKFGKVFGLKDKTCVYRRNQNGISTVKPINFNIKFFHHKLEIFNQFKDILDNDDIRYSLSNMSFNIFIKCIKDFNFFNSIEYLIYTLKLDTRPIIFYIKKKINI